MSKKRKYNMNYNGPTLCMATRLFRKRRSPFWRRCHWNILIGEALASPTTWTKTMHLNAPGTQTGSARQRMDTSEMAAENATFEPDRTRFSNWVRTWFTRECKASMERPATKLIKSSPRSRANGATGTFSDLLSKSASAVLSLVENAISS